MALPARPKLASGPTTKQQFDVIVIGAQLGGVLCGALLQKRGYRVLHVEHDGVAGGYEHGGYLLPYAPFILPPLKSMPLVDDAFHELGIQTQFQRAQRPHAPDLQLVSSLHRLDLHADDHKRLKELQRELAADAEPLDAALKTAFLAHEPSDAFFKSGPELPPDGFFEGWGLKKRIKQHPGLDTPLSLPLQPLSALLYALRPFVSFSHGERHPIARARALGQILRSPLRYPGGRDGVRELLQKRLQDLGGEVLAKDGHSVPVVEELSFDGSRLEGVKLLKSENIYKGTTLVAATDAGALRRLLTDKKKHRKLAEELETSKPKEFLFTVNWVLPARLLPRGMGELVLFSTEDAELPRLLLQTSWARKVGAKADETDALVITAGAFVPAAARELGEDHLRELADKLEAQLDRLLPFVRQKLLGRSAPYLDAGSVRGSRLLPHPLFDAFEEEFLGVTGLRQRTATKNLFLANREVLPGLGLEGELMAGIRAARLVQESLRKRKPTGL